MADTPQSTISVPKNWLADVAQLLNVMAGDGIEIEDCADPATLMTDLATFLGVADLDNCWAASVQRLCAP